MPFWRAQFCELVLDRLNKAPDNFWGFLFLKIHERGSVCEKSLKKTYLTS